MPTPVPQRLFSPTSVWNMALSAGAPIDPSSSPRMAALMVKINEQLAGRWGPWINTTQYSTPIYTVGPDQPRVPVKLDVSWDSALRDALAAGVPIPANAVPAAGSDQHITVYQPSSDTLWETWVTTKQADGWHARWGGVMQHVSTNPGYFTSDSWPGLQPWQGWGWGATATSLPVAAGTIRIDELRRGVIDHALAVAVPEACSTVFSWPAQRTDGYTTTPDCMPEGARLRLDPTLDLTKLNLPRITFLLAQAAQRYGLIVRDKTGGVFTFYAEDPTPTGSNPYTGPNGLFGGLDPWNFLPQFPWSRLQVLKLSPCTKAPCAP